MNKLIIDLENCYGIKKLQKEFDFSENRAIAVYAPNGMMKSSLAQTFKDLSEDIQSKDRIFPERVCKRVITDENAVDIPMENIHVISPYDESITHTEKTSTLLVNSKLRLEYENLYLEINKSKEFFLKVLREQSGSKKNLDQEIITTFDKNDRDGFFDALICVKYEVQNQNDSPFANIKYDIIFDDKVLSLLETKDFKNAIENYIKKLNELITASKYFKRGTFNYFNASTIAKNLSDNGFFEAKHSVNLNAEDKLEITSKEELEQLIAKEKEGISNDVELKRKFSEIEKLISKNINTRDFQAYIEEHEEILPKLENIGEFKKEVWKSYFKEKVDLYLDLIEKYMAVEQRKKEIEEEAEKQQTQWEEVIEIFENRFSVPFELTAINRVPVILGKDQMLSLEFTFLDGADHASIKKDELMRVLSTGEKKAFYILNIIFEIEARKKARQETVFIIDDVADSFDYKNKYAIIQYLIDIDKEPYFYQIILTHNFDFFRTINSKYIKYSNCFLASKCSDGISFNKATGIKNVFINDWKLNYFTDLKKKIASIPFIRNIIEYTKGENDPSYLKLTSLLHWKSDSATITICDLDNIFNSTFSTKGSTSLNKRFIIDIIKQEADECLICDESINFENKIVLSISIRIFAEQFMIAKIKDTGFTDSIKSDQTTKLFEKFKELFPGNTNQNKIIQQVILMTPENIHLNSFMYEPIIDMSDEHLRKLFQEVKDLK